MKNKSEILLEIEILNNLIKELKNKMENDENEKK